MDKQCSANLKIKSNCEITLINIHTGEEKNYCYHNTVTERYLKQLTKPVVGEATDFNPEIIIMEITESDDTYIARKQVVDSWSAGNECTLISYWSRTEGNGSIGKFKFFAGTDADTTEGTGEEASSVSTDTITKTTDYNMNIVYNFKIENA